MSRILRIEAVNLGNFIYDTADLNTVRGSGLMLLKAIEEIEIKFSSKLSKVSSGASTGLFEIIDGADSIQSEVRRFLADEFLNFGGGSAALKYGTFVLDVVAEPEGAGFVTAKEMALAANRFRQMQSPTIYIPPTNNDTNAEACFLDRQRPAIDKDRLPGDKNEKVSPSVKARRDYGKDRKHQFYEDTTGIDATFTNEFETLTSDKNKGNLHNKMAVIYLDGNSFGKIQDEHCEDLDSLKAFDEAVQNYRKSFLKEAIEAAQKDKDWKNGDEIRLETLLWGGDEMLYVVPAWKGWEFITAFYKASDKWVFGSTDLTHCAGVVFCHHSAPIGRIRQLAETLANDVKDNTGRNGNYFTYETLESFDHIGQDLNEYRQKRLPGTFHNDARKKALSLDGRRIVATADLVSAFHELKNVVPRRRLYRIASMLIKEKARPADNDPILEEINEILGEMEGSRSKLAAVANVLCPPGSSASFADDGTLVSALRDDPVIWIHLNNLWDYIGQPSGEDEQDA